MLLGLMLRSFRNLGDLYEADLNYAVVEGSSYSTEYVA